MSEGDIKLDDTAGLRKRMMDLVDLERRRDEIDRRFAGATSNTMQFEDVAYTVFSAKLAIGYARDLFNVYLDTYLALAELREAAKKPPRPTGGRPPIADDTRIRIEAALDRGETMGAIATQFGVSKMTVSRVAKRRLRSNDAQP